jgi:hypothetical protein
MSAQPRQRSFSAKSKLELLPGKKDAMMPYETICDQTRWTRWYKRHANPDATGYAMRRLF